MSRRAWCTQLATLSTLCERPARCLDADLLLREELVGSCCAGAVFVLGLAPPEALGAGLAAVVDGAAARLEEGPDACLDSLLLRLEARFFFFERPRDSCHSPSSKEDEAVDEPGLRRAEASRAPAGAGAVAGAGARASAGATVAATVDFPSDTLRAFGAGGEVEAVG